MGKIREKKTENYQYVIHFQTSSVKSTSSHEETTSSSPVKTRRKRAAVGSGSVESAKRGHVTRGRGSRGRGRGGRGSRGARGGSGKKRSQTDDAASRIKEHTEKRTALIEVRFITICLDFEVVTCERKDKMIFPVRSNDHSMVH